MCLGVPGQVVSVEGRTAIVDFFGIRRETRLDVVDEPVSPGDYILNHVGFAIRRIPSEEIEETLALYETLLGEAGGDMMADDVRGEIEATSVAGAPAPGLGALFGVGPTRGPEVEP
jgi:hydrogenase expression/formation protein HypC